MRYLDRKLILQESQVGSVESTLEYAESLQSDILNLDSTKLRPLLLQEEEQPKSVRDTFVACLLMLGYKTAVTKASAISKMSQIFIHQRFN